MAERGAPLGNHNNTKNRLWRENIDRAIAQDEGKRLRKAAEQLLTLAAQGEAWAVKELGDRLDGKSVQAIANANGETFKVEEVKRAIIDTVSQDDNNA